MRHWSQDYWKKWSSSQCGFSSLTFMYIVRSSLKSHQYSSFNVRVRALDHQSTSISKMDQWTKAFCSQTFRLSLNILSKKKLQIIWVQFNRQKLKLSPSLTHTQQHWRRHTGENEGRLGVPVCGLTTDVQRIRNKFIHLWKGNKSWLWFVFMHQTTVESSQSVGGHCVGYSRVLHPVNLWRL